MHAGTDVGDIDTTTKSFMVYITRALETERRLLEIIHFDIFVFSFAEVVAATGSHTGVAAVCEEERDWLAGCCAKAECVLFVLGMSEMTVFAGWGEVSCCELCVCVCEV